MTDTKNAKLIYPAIVPGLRVRHRETLEERTVAYIADLIVEFERGLNHHIEYFWARYEPVPQPGDRVRVVRSEHDHCIGVTGLLDGPDVDGEWHTGDEHFGPLSDFEVILPEESETNMTDFPGNSLPNTTMTDNETVAVPVELLRNLRDAMAGKGGRDVYTEAVALMDLLPKPKPRLVAIALDRCRFGNGYNLPEMEAMPDLLDTAFDVIAGILGVDDARTLTDALATRLGADCD